MSECRCNEILDWESKIRTLESAKSGFGTTNQAIYNINGESNYHRIAYAKMATMTTMNKTLSQIDTLDAQMRAMEGAVEGQISEHLFRMQGELEEMKREDTDYHEEERRREEEEQEARLRAQGLLK